ncbi:hypothetical protein CFC21_007809 [Triticum aestivum]|uniref:Uncharacterized protein n=2 Tax=Triticum aestivum TaxID=4565 RepID=A0A3B5Z1P7_WHEAT|nr:uncharacterized protein LOC119308183 [Triticum dicoccoides]XP_044372132.1 uncharacterized protein LOC123094130 [Triticum aestivum]KAF6990638.1 hypothetical protein CFC21_007809 [Triticum aestivum]
MGNSLRCCLACMLPCGALDVVRVVHLSGHVDEFTCPLIASDVLAAHPSHALTAAGSAGAARRIVIVSPDSELKRGRIYFLIPTACSAPAAELKRPKQQQQQQGHGACQSKTKRRHGHGHRKGGTAVAAAASTAEQDNYLRELLSEKRESGHRRRRSSSARAGVWRPRLESIAEEPSD